MNVVDTTVSNRHKHPVASLRRSLYYRSHFLQNKAPGRTVSLYHPKLFILRRHFHEISESLRKYLGPLSRAVDPSDANAFVGFGEFSEVFPRYGVLLECEENVIRKNEFFQPRTFAGPRLHVVANALQSEASHFSGFHESPNSFFVHFGKGTLLSSGSEPLQPTFSVARLRETVNPTEAERLFNRIVVRDSLLAAPLFIID